MPPLPDAPSCIRLLFKGTNQGQPFLCGTYLSNAPTALSQADMNGVATAAMNAWDTTILTQMHGQVAMIQTDAIDISHRGGFTGVALSAQTGDLVGVNYLPVNVAVVVSEKVGFRWRGGHPRMYLPAPLQTQVENGKDLIAAYLGTINTAVDNFRTALNAIQVQGVNLRWSCVRYHADKVALAIPIILNVDDAIVHKRLDSQRRRLGKEVV